jgi:hypothetical protein
MRNKPLKGLISKSPMKQKVYDFSKKKDYSPEATKGSIGDKIARAVTPDSAVDVIPFGGKAVKAGKAIYKYFSS